jgi:hypothetical protein
MSNIDYGLAIATAISFGAAAIGVKTKLDINWFYLGWMFAALTWVV